MKFRSAPFMIVPVHSRGYIAPPLYVNADTYEQAKKIAKERCSLVTKYPETWRLI